MLGSARRSAIPPFEVMTILAKVAQRRAAGLEVLSLCAGEPAQGAPAAVRARAAELLGDGTDLGYTSTFGLQQLREAVAGHYRRWYGLGVPAERICLTTGASGAFVIGFLASFDAGARVALARPGYPAYANILRSVDCAVVELDCGPAVRFQPTPELLTAEVAANGPLDGLILASPANPTGTMVSREQLAAIVDWCAQNQVRLVSDEIYHGLTAGADRGTCAWEFSQDPIVISSFSKFWAMTGWRLGWMLVPVDLVSAVDAIASNVALCAPAPAQYAAMGAFSAQSYAEGEAAVANHDAGRRLVLAAARELGWQDIAPADGAFYVYANIAPVLGRYPDSRAWCDGLLAATGVAVTPGFDFDRVNGPCTIRISLAAGVDTVAEAMRRIKEFAQNREY